MCAATCLASAASSCSTSWVTFPPLCALAFPPLLENHTTVSPQHICVWQPPCSPAWAVKLRMTPPSFFVPTSASSQSVQRTGTPPLSRNSSNSYAKRSSVVPFTRQRRSNDESGNGSFSDTGSLSQPGTPGIRSRRHSSGQGLPQSFEDPYGFSHSPATSRRSEPESRARRGPPPVVREEGATNQVVFSARADSASLRLAGCIFA